MRNAGDRSPSGSAGRRQRAAAPDASAPASGNGGSLFTPAYRVNRPGSAPSEAAARGQAAGYGETGYPQAEAGYTWASDHGAASQGGGYSGDGDLASGGSDWPDEPASTLYSWADDDAAGDPWPQASLPGHQLRSSVSNAVRGLPPEPGDPPHVYPPGPFAAWNRTSSADASPLGARRGDPDRQLAAATITPDEFDTDFSMPAIKDPAPSGAGRAAPARDGSGSRSRTAPSRRGATPPAGRSGSSGADARSAATRGSRPATSGGGPRRPASGRAGQGSGHHSVKVAVGAAAAIVVAVALVLVLTSHGGGQAGSAGAPRNNARSSHSPSASPSPSTPGGIWRYIAVRATDPVKLTAQELYPVGFTAAGISYRRSIAAKSVGCRSALIGSSLQAAVHRAGCTQAIRASYFSSAAKMMATIGVFNLKTYTGAGAAASAAGRSEFVAQLPAHSGPTREIGEGTGIEYAGVKGHYLVLVYAEFINLRTPSTSAQRSRLNDFISTLIADTVNISLSYRMANGKPMPSS